MLKRVSIQNFKSLKDVTLDLQKVNLLIGPNNSGKTNFLKALEYIASVDTSNNKSIVIPHNISFRDTNAEYSLAINIHLTFSKTDSDREEYAALLSTGYGDYQYRQWPDTVDDKAVISSLHNSNKNLGFIRHSELQGSLLYKVDVAKLIHAGPVGNREEFVNSDASNLVGFLDLMLGKYRKTVFNRTEQDLNVCIPEFDEISLEDASPSQEIQKNHSNKSFKRIGLTNSELSTTYWADELSEGTLYFLALLCIINQPNPPKLLLLEEPEKGIHPRRIFEVIQFIFRLAEEKDVQVIMTTHSPIVVDMFKDMPESVFIFDKDEEGATHVKNLQRDVIEPDVEKSKELGIEPHHYTDSLGDAWTVGFLGGVPK